MPLFLGWSYLHYKVPESIRKIALQGEFNEFDLNVFFSTTGDKEKMQSLCMRGMFSNG